MTHKFKLPSGVDCEIGELTGRQQEILTEQNKKPHNEKLSQMLATILVKVGDIINVTEEFINKEMLSCDRAYALTMARQFSWDFEHEFVFNHKYKDGEGKKQVVEIREKVEEGKFPMRVTHTYVKDAEGEISLIPVQVANYRDIVKDITIVLPRSKKEVRFTRLTGAGELVGIKTAKNKRSSNTPLKMRNPIYYEVKKEKKIPISLDLNKLALRDIEFLRTAIKEVEGKVDTEILFENHATEKTETMNVLQSIAFFFPSEAI